MSQNICRYFLNGNCKFGDRCRYQHSSFSPNNFQNRGFPQQTITRTIQPSPQYSKVNNNRFAVLADNKPAPSAAAATTGNEVLNVNHILQTVNEDMAMCEVGRIWPFSSYGYFRCVPSLPGLEDISQEEVRHQAYTARDERRFDEFVASFNNVVADYKHKHSSLARPNQQQREILLHILDKINCNKTNLIDSSQVDGLFSRSIASSNVFGSSTSAGFKPQQTNADAFFRQAISDMNTNGSVPSGPLFGSSGAGNVFGGTLQSGNARSGFAVNTASMNTQPTFQSQFSTGNVFGGAQQTTNNQNDLFNTNSTSSQSVNPPQVSTTVNSSSACSLYTPLSELAETELQEFQAAKFKCGKIPSRPPPLELIS